jgi:hypothetical protein
MPPAIFLFLTGVTLAFLMDSRERRGLRGRLRVMAALRRASFLFMLAFLFRLQMWAFSLPGSPWTDLLRVDILNAMGLALGLVSVMAVFRTAERAPLSAAVGLMIAGISPLVSQFDWTGVPSVVKNYLAPDYLFFGFFPWGAFVAFGVSAGSVLRLIRKDQMDRAMQSAALLGFALVLGGQYCADLPYSVYPKSEFWLNSPWLILIKLGIILLLLAAAYLWTQHGARHGWSWVQQFGTTSLLVYWVHTELIYGRWLNSWKENLTNGQAFLVAIGVILLMLGLSAAKTHWKSLHNFRFSVAFPSFVPRRVSGDWRVILEPTRPALMKEAPPHELQ